MDQILTRGDLQELSKKRIEEAETLLLNPGRSLSDGAYYLAGYAVELALKACIIVRLRNSEEFPAKKFSENCYTHNLNALLHLAGLETTVKADRKLAFNWAIVQDWNETSRYLERDPAAAASLIHAVSDPAHGVLPWLMKLW